MKKFNSMLALLLLWGAGAFAQKPVLNISLKAYVEQKTVAYYGGLAAIKDSINLQVSKINAAYNADARFTHTYNYTVGVFQVYDNSNTFIWKNYWTNLDEVIDSSKYYQYVKPADGNNVVRLVYDAFPREGSVAVNYTQAVNIFYKQNRDNQGSIFSNRFTKALVHEFGHVRGQLDLYNGKVPVIYNQVNQVRYENGYNSIMNNCYNETGFDPITIGVLNRNASLLGNAYVSDVISSQRAFFPTTTQIRVKDALGNPINNAQVKLYGAQSYIDNGKNGVISSTPTISGATNAAGLLSFVGESQNPFDLVSNSGFSSKYATFYVGVTYNGQTRYGWLSHVDAMNAKATGNDTYTLDIALPAGTTQPANVAPIVAWGISGGLVIYKDQVISLGISVTDPDGDVSKANIKVFKNGVLASGTPYFDAFNQNWWYTINDNTTPGEFAYSIEVRDEKGALAINNDVAKYVVIDPAQAIKVAIASPLNNASVSVGTVVPLSARFSSAVKTIARIDYYNGATLLGSSTTIPFGINWTPTAQGSYSITAVAFDTINNTKTSAPINVTVTAASGCSGIATYCVYPCIYNQGDFVQYNGVKYQAQSSGLYNVTPGTAEQYWKTIGACGASNPAPVVSLTSPANNTSVNQPATITISANASDDVSISKVEFYNGTTLLNTDVTAPYSYSWTGVTAGTYAIKAIAYDNLNASTSSSVANVTVINPAPTVALTSPTNNQVFATTPATIAIAANANDDGTISKVEFFNGTTLLNSDATAPYSYSWTGVAAGNYTITAKAYDNQNAITTSSAVTIQVGNQAPTVTLTSPTNGFSVNQVASISIAATANDADGTISKVEFYNGATLLNSDATAPFAFTWTGVVAGNYAIKAIAYDNLNASTSSSVANVTVINPAPTVTLNTPTNNQSFNPAPASVSITATAADADGTVSKVEFYNGTTLLNSDVTAPFAYTWSGVAAGTYAITAKAYDNQNKVTTSSVANITVVGAGGTCTAPVYNAATAYNGGQSVQYNGIKYTANWWTQGAQPDLNNGAVGTGKPWTSNGTCTARLGDATSFATGIYPNPSNGEFTIVVEENATAVILNAVGKEVTTLALVKGNNNVALSLATGVYFVNINNQVTKLVIE